MVVSLVSGDVFVTERQLDDLLFTYQRLAVCDRRFMKYYSDRLSRQFECFSDDQVCNFARYLVKSVHARAQPMEIGATADYSREFGPSDTKALLDDFDVTSSSYVRCLESQLPVCLHQYSYYNLVDLGEFYGLFNIQSSVRVRFSTELWKYLYTLRYGYPVKALVVLSKLGLGDGATFGRLIRNIPMTLAFRWPLNLVSECLISLEWAKSSKIYVILAHYLSRYLSAQFNARNIARIFDSLCNKRIALLGLYQKVLRIQSLNPGWLSCEELLTVARYGKEVGFSLAGISRLLKGQDLDDMDYRKAMLLYVMDNPDAALVKRCIQAVHNKDSDQTLEFVSLMQLLKACYRHKMWLSAAPQLALEALRDIETIEVPVLLELLDLLTLAGPIGEPDLLARLEGYVKHVIPDLPLRTAGKMLWLCFSLGVAPDSVCFLSLLRRFNHLYEPSYNENHLLQVLGEALKRLKSQTVEIRTFLGHLETFKDVSWRREPAEIGKIREFQRNIGCKAFVSVFPFTADIEVDAAALSDYVARVGGGSISLADPCLPSRSSWSASSDIVDTVLLDLCGDPYVTVVERDGNERQTLRFYYQLRSSLVGRPFAHLLDSSVP
ncbi:hypothetical protein, conserved [Babesia ovata]|uniref:Uncharacterized protein n=1 Tax=Babesia ovata TaxID=189622 RepID=A0A2H6KB56_9APIC|nr:uncharacterized protein BOVATA_017260 [Babesia ovata]GBE60233.1 hypothetical protein, conserved [Babesia ovata]